MRSVVSRIERIEDKLNVGKRHLIVKIMWFGDGPLPPDQRTGNILVRHIPYAQVQQKGVNLSRRETRS